MYDPKLTVGWLAEQFRRRANEDPAEHTERDAADVEQLKDSVETMLNLLVRNLEAWEDEEDSVKEEHEELITELRNFLNEV